MNRQGAVKTLADLSRVRVGVVQGTATEDALVRMRMGYRTVPLAAEGLRNCEMER
jgi:polar amino acid transport system substrate-binding protein